MHSLSLGGVEEWTRHGFADSDEIMLGNKKVRMMVIEINNEKRSLMWLE